MQVKRVMLKLSGEMFQTEAGSASGIDFEQLKLVAKRLFDFKKSNNLQLAIVVGGGNFWRFRDSHGSGIDHVQADQMGMQATVLNAVALQSALRNLGDQAQAFTAVQNGLAPDYNVEDAKICLEDDMTVICAGGTGNPFFTTDSAAVLRALELECELLLKGTKVDGVYSADPNKDPKAERFATLSFDEVMKRKLEVMDFTAFALANEQKLSILVFDFANQETLTKILDKPELGTLVS